MLQDISLTPFRLKEYHRPISAQSVCPCASLKTMKIRWGGPFAPAGFGSTGFPACAQLGHPWVAVLHVL